MDLLLDVRCLSVSFGGVRAVNSLDLEIRKGEIVGLIGPNGAGKTTAFNAVTGRIRPSSGAIFFCGAEITGWPSPRIARNGIARTFQNIKLYEDLSVIENVMIAAHSSISYSFLEAIFGFGRFSADESRIRSRAEELLKLMNLKELAFERASSLPYGSQRKLEIARALALEPKLLLLDEPVAGMNPTETREFGGFLLRLRDNLSIGVGLIDHDMSFVMEVCDKIRVIDHGIPIAWGTPFEIRNDNKVIAAYLGTDFGGQPVDYATN
ncbi:MAG: ABC transporter ATP-binding protein [Deltaproteobacteria bacterium]|nr:ABC transporter ATP-binding protein [Deltaproteobacteria bacterium]